LGLANPHREGFEFGRGWEIVDSKVRMVTPRALDLTAIPVAWTPPTDGTIRGEVVVAPMNRVEHFAAYRGKLRGKIVLVSLPGKGSEPTEPVFQRLSDKDIGEEDSYDQPNFDPDAANFRVKRRQFPAELDAFLASEGALAWARMSYRDGKLLHGEGYNFVAGKSLRLPGVELAAEDYRRLVRVAKTGAAPTLEIRSDTRFHDEDRKAYNIIADLPGTDPKAGYVMAGAHLDSWVAGDGASDNGAGAVVVMEAARILRAVGARPKRTIRFALWAGEEQGLLGSLAYIDQHLASRPASIDPAGDEVYRWSTLYPITPKPGFSALKAYFNMDNGSGRLRGIYAEGNAAAVPLLREWLSPFAGMDANHVVIGTTSGTDHVYMQSVGIPAYQFVQDPLDYETRIHHSSVDTVDHMKDADLRQAAVVMAGVLLAAANSDKELPRQPVPSQPKPTDPFKVDYPEPR
jgi:carboxypeptidase Q